MHFKYFLESVTYFTTAKGSSYEFSNQKTIRNKTPHAFHLPSDQGIKPQSEFTVFIDFALSKEIGWWQNLSSSKKRIILFDNKIVLVSFNQVQNKHGVDKVNANPSYLLQPQIGLCPLELTNRDMHQWTWLKPGMLVFSGSHPGSPIVKIT